MNNIDLTPIFEAIITIIAALITTRLIPWIKTKTTNEQQALMYATAKTLVFAAEQLYGAGEGAAKMDYVINHLEAKGFTADRDSIEAIVKENIANLHAAKPVAPEAVE